MRVSEEDSGDANGPNRLQRIGGVALVALLLAVAAGIS
jgi:hypothetical protein